MLVNVFLKQKKKRLLLRIIYMLEIAIKLLVSSACFYIWIMRKRHFLNFKWKTVSHYRCYSVSILYLSICKLLGFNLLPFSTKYRLSVIEIINRNYFYFEDFKNKLLKITLINPKIVIFYLEFYYIKA